MCSDLSMYTFWSRASCLSPSLMYGLQDLILSITDVSPAGVIREIASHVCVVRSTHLISQLDG